MDDILAKLCLTGEERETVLEKIRETVLSWGLKLPDVPGDLTHFGYNTFYEIGETEFNINNNTKEGYCGKFMFQFQGQNCPMHHHVVKHETFYIVKGKVEMILDGKKLILSQGDISVVDQKKKHTFTALEDSLILESSTPDYWEDSIFEDRRINDIIAGEI